MKLKALEYEFPAQTVENKKSREEEVERRKEYIAGFDNFLQVNSFFKRWESNTMFQIFMVQKSKGFELRTKDQ